MSAGMERRLSHLEALAGAGSGGDAKVVARAGAAVREWCGEYGVPCWPKGEDERHREWAWEHGTPALKSFLHVFHGEVLSQAVSRGIDLPDDARENPWPFDAEALDAVCGEDDDGGDS